MMGTHSELRGTEEGGTLGRDDVANDYRVSQATRTLPVVDSLAHGGQGNGSPWGP